MRWTMQPTRATTRSQHASRVIAALQLIVTTFVMHAMLGRCPRQLKMPRPDAYTRSMMLVFVAGRSDTRTAAGDVCT